MEMVHLTTSRQKRAYLMAYLVEWHLEQKLAPLLFRDDDRETARKERPSPVAPAKVSSAAKKKAGRKRTRDGFPVHSMTTLLADLGTLTLNDVCLPKYPDHAFTIISEPKPLQRKALALLGLNR